MTEPAKPNAIEQYRKFEVFIQGELQERIDKALAATGRGIDPAYWRQVLLGAVRHDMTLVTECDPGSLIAAVQSCANVGLFPDRQNGHVYLLPFWNGKTKRKEVMFLLGYRGMIELALRNKIVESVIARAVHGGDEFYYELGTSESIRHVPAMSNKRGRELSHVYAICRFRDRPPIFVVMDKGEVDAVRSRAKAQDSGPWVTDYAAMAMKSAVRNLSRWIPMDNATRAAIEDDAALDDGIVDVETDGVTTANVRSALQQEMAARTAPKVKALAAEIAPAYDETQHVPPEEAIVDREAASLNVEPVTVAKRKTATKKVEPAVAQQPAQGREPGEDDDLHDDSPIGQLFKNGGPEPSIDPQARKGR